MTQLVDLLNAPAAIVGTTGAGKTFAAKGAVEELLRLGRRVVIIDPTGAWYGLRSGADGDEAGGFPVMIFGGDHADIEITDQSGAAIAEAIAGREVQAIIDVSEMTGGEKTRFLTDFLQTLYARNKAALHLIVDEADEVCPQNPMPEERRLSGAFDKIVRRGRIKGFRPLMITQRPAVLHKNVLSQIGTLVALKLTSPQDRKAIEDWVKGNADTEAARVVMNSLPALSRGEGWVWSPAASVLERRSFPAISTFDSSRTPDAGEAVVEPALSSVDVDTLRAAIVPPGEPTKPAKNIPQNITAEIKAAERRGFEQGYAEGRLHGFGEGLTEAKRRVLDFAGSLIVDDTAAPPQRTPKAAVPAVAEPKPPARPTAPPQPTQPSSTPSGIPASLQRCIDAIAWWHDIGFAEVDRDRAAITAGLSPTASTFGVYLGKLRELGLVENAGPGAVRLTAGGSGEANHDPAPDPSDVVTKALGLLKSKPAAILRMLSDAYPSSIARDEIADRMGLSRTASTLGVYISAASRLGFIENAGPGQVRAAAFLFPQAGGGQT